MNRKLTITITLIALLCAALAGQALAQTRIAGVKGNDYLVYSTVSHWKPENASEASPAGLAEWNNTQQYKIAITQINGVNVTGTHTWDFKNGTQIPYLLTLDIESGTPYFISQNYPPPEGVEAIVGANLKPGDILHPAGNDTVTINQTITRNYASGSRETNVVDLSSPIQNETIDSTTNASVLVTIGNQDVTYYIDKATGVLVEKNTVVASINPNETLSITWTLKQTNLWDASPPASNLTLIITIVVVVVVIAVAAVVIFKRKPSGKKSRR